MLSHSNYFGFADHMWRHWAQSIVTSHLVSAIAKPHPLTLFFFKWAIPGLFSLFSSFQYTVDCKQMFNINNKFLPMTGFEPRTSGIGRDRSTNWATTTSACNYYLPFISHTNGSGRRLSWRVLKLIHCQDNWLSHWHDLFQSPFRTKIFLHSQSNSCFAQAIRIKGGQVQCDQIKIPKCL